MLNNFFITILISICAIAIAKPQDEPKFRFSAVTPATTMHQIAFVQSTTDVIDEEVVIESTRQSSDSFAQCLYDFQGNRVNRGCVIAERPLQCSRGTLVQMLVGTEYEMCCCNFAIMN